MQRVANDVYQTQSRLFGSRSDNNDLVVHPPRLKSKKTKIKLSFISIIVYGRNNTYFVEGAREHVHGLHDCKIVGRDRAQREPSCQLIKNFQTFPINSDIQTSLKVLTSRCFVAIIVCVNVCVNERGIMSNSERLDRYIKNKKRMGQKRVSFFVEEKVWKFFKKNASSKDMSINDYLKHLLNFK